MSEKDEREQIREQKRKELIEKHSGEQAETTGKQDTSKPIEVESQTHFEEVTTTHDVVLVDCYADWCGPCQMMEPTVQTLAAETDAVVAKVDVDAHQRLAQELGAQGVPTFIVFAGGEPTKRLVGAQDRSTLERLLQQAR